MTHRRGTSKAHLGNVPTQSEVRFIATFIGRELQVLERAPVNGDSAAERFARARMIAQALKDLASADGGGYQLLIDSLNAELDVSARLDRVLTSNGQMLAEESEPSLDLRVVQPAPRPGRDTGTTRYDLDDYLHVLGELPPSPTPPVGIAATANWQRYIRTCEVLLDYLADLIGRPLPLEGSSRLPSVPRLTFLLRDTLLLFLGARRLEAQGVPLKASAAMVSRQMIASFTPRRRRNPLYADLYNKVFACLEKHDGRFGAAFVSRYSRAVRGHRSPENARMLRFTYRYLHRTLGDSRDAVFVDNGVHGTMPLLAMVVTPASGGLRMYTAVPWLQEFYRDVIFSRDSSQMRDLERVVCQEQLFHFSGVVGDRIMVTQTLEPAVVSYAQAEIGYFLSAVDRRFRPGADTTAADSGVVDEPSRTS